MGTQSGTGMVRKQVYIERRQDQLLKRRAKELGVTEAELVRRSLDLAGAAHSPVAPDPDAWREEQAFILRRGRIRAAQTGRTWTRESLYERG